MAAILSRPHSVFVFVFDELYLYLYLIRFLPVYLYLYLYLKLRKKNVFVFVFVFDKTYLTPALLDTLLAYGNIPIAQVPQCVGGGGGIFKGGGHFQPCGWVGLGPLIYLWPPPGMSE